MNEKGPYALTARDINCGGDPIERPNPRRTILSAMVTFWIGTEIGDKTVQFDSAIAESEKAGRKREAVNEMNHIISVGSM